MMSLATSTVDALLDVESRAADDPQGGDRRRKAPGPEGDSISGRTRLMPPLCLAAASSADMPPRSIVLRHRSHTSTAQRQVTGLLDEAAQDEYSKFSPGRWPSEDLRPSLSGTCTSDRRKRLRHLTAAAGQAWSLFGRGHEAFEHESCLRDLVDERDFCGSIVSGSLPR